MVTTEQLTLFALSKYYHHNEITNDLNPSAILPADDDDWVRPTLRAHFRSEHSQTWKTVRVPIGKCAVKVCVLHLAILQVSLLTPAEFALNATLMLVPDQVKMM